MSVGKRAARGACSARVPQFTWPPGPATTLRAALRAVLGRARPDKHHPRHGLREFARGLWEFDDTKLSMGSRRRRGRGSFRELPGQVVLQGCLAELVCSSSRAEDFSVPGVFKEGHQTNRGNVAEKL